MIQGVLWHPFSILLLLQRFCSSLNGELLDCGIYIIVFVYLFCSKVPVFWSQAGLLSVLNKSLHLCFKLQHHVLPQRLQHHLGLWQK